MMIRRSLTVAMVLLFGAMPLAAERALVGVATNFAEPAAAIVDLFEATSPHDVTLSAGSTGQLFAQIVNGAPYDLFLSADQARPALLVEAQQASRQTTYAVGRLALWSADPSMPLDLATLQIPRQSGLPSQIQRWRLTGWQRRQALRTLGSLPFWMAGL